MRYANGKDYVYSHDSAGADVVNQMKKLAEQGKGLTSFIRSNRPNEVK